MNMSNKYQEYNKKKIKELSAYRDSYLNNNDKEFMAGFDWCIDHVIKPFFCNINIYDKELKSISYFSKEIFSDIDNEMIVDERTILNNDYSNEELSKMNDKTKFFKVLKECMEHWIDVERDELVVSMLDDRNVIDFDNQKE